MSRCYYALIFVLTVALSAGCSKSQTSTVILPITVVETTKNPMPDLALAAAAGKSLYVVNCSLCHGADGRLAEDSLEAKPPDLTSGKITSDPDGAIFLTIKNGVKKEGRLTMPPAKKLSDEEIWQLVAYVRTLASK